jgi:hypothetical protein
MRGMAGLIVQSIISRFITGLSKSSNTRVMFRIIVVGA